LLALVLVLALDLLATRVAGVRFSDAGVSGP
jgi:hypothetical protein